ncbi:DEAD/DEAH box helicase [Candidatus Bathyarchaeota archaeon]|nr:DEAD/DEAH box helicase [Candidatus Bathyarchaeota archaeon]
MRVLTYGRGQVTIDGAPVYLDNLKPMKVFPAYMYRMLVEHLERSGEPFRDEAAQFLDAGKLSTSFKLRDYQEAALSSWDMGSSRGVVVLPTGAGKTILAVKAIEKLNVSTIILVPTIVLVEQWRSVLQQAFNTEIGAIGGGNMEILPITVSTYDSASLRSRKLGNLFQFIIFDEVHHLTAPSYRRIAQRYLAPFRLGLTATMPKEEAYLEVIFGLVGEKNYQLDVDDLAGKHLAEYAVKTVKLPLTGYEKAEYDKQFEIYRKFLRTRGIKIRSPRDYMSLVKRTGRDPEARRAITARTQAMDIAYTSDSKIAYLKSLLRANPDEKTIIFTRQNKLVYRLSRDLLIPAITHRTPREERNEILRMFHSGGYKRVLTSRVLDEGVDVPDASIAVIISGSGSNRQFVQRLGRILRPGPGKQAVLFELVSAGTAETYISDRRKRS